MGEIPRGRCCVADSRKTTKKGWVARRAHNARPIRFRAQRGRSRSSHPILMVEEVRPPAERGKTGGHVTASVFLLYWATVFLIYSLVEKDNALSQRGMIIAVLLLIAAGVWR